MEFAQWFCAAITSSRVTGPVEPGGADDWVEKTSSLGV